mmetsp:Transcript_25173/g.44893  ORF Transcript_25173/g.44893 Transcript_25173/m.44893 type:complete len:336 (-) Transcript_25173:492-1499(-)
MSLQLGFQVALLHSTAKLRDAHLKEQHPAAEGVEEVRTHGLVRQRSAQGCERGRGSLGECVGRDELLGGRIARVQHTGERVEVYAGGEINRSAKVDQLHFAVYRDQNVLRLDISVHNADAVQFAKRLQNLLQNAPHNQGVSLGLLVATRRRSEEDLRNVRRKLSQRALDRVVQRRVALKVPNHPLRASDEATARLARYVLPHVPRHHRPYTRIPRHLSTHVLFHLARFCCSLRHGTLPQEIFSDARLGVRLDVHLFHHHSLALLLWRQHCAAHSLLILHALKRDTKVSATQAVAQREHFTLEIRGGREDEGPGDVEIDDGHKWTGLRKQNVPQRP